jgi:hypothetical protein
MIQPISTLQSRPINQSDISDDNLDDTNNNNNSMVMIEMGDLNFVDIIDPIENIDLVSVDLTLDQDLSEDERSITRTYQSFAP